MNMKSRMFTKFEYVMRNNILCSVFTLKMKRHFLLIFFLLLASSVHAQEISGMGMATESWTEEDPARGRLTEQEIERVRVLKQLIRDVDMRSLEQTIHEIETDRYPVLKLQMQEAIAKTYADIVREQEVVDQDQKDWLYSMVTINMAYLQFGGSQKDPGNSLNKLIRRKLEGHLPAEVFTHPGFLKDLE